MSEEIKKTKPKADTYTLNVIICSMFTVTAVLLLWFRGLETLKPVYIVNTVADITGMCVALVICICGMLDAKKSGAYHRVFFSLTSIVFMGLFTDEVAWLVDGLPHWRWVNIIDNSVYYLCCSLVACFFWLYVTRLLGAEEAWERRVTSILKLSTLAIVISLVANLCFKFYFDVGKDGVYERHILYPVPMIFAMLVLLLSFLLVIKKREKLKQRQRVVLGVYIVMPFIVSILTVAVYGLSLIFAALVVILVLMYSMVNLERGIDKAMIDKDLTLAAKIQSGVLPQKYPAFPEQAAFDLYAAMFPAKEVGGDFYDYFMIDDDHIALLIADVSGKGVPASLFMMVSKSLIKNRLQNGDTPGQALFNVNDQLLSGGQGLMFVTVWLAILDIHTGEGVAVNAGHEHPILKKKDGRYEAVVYKHSVPLATMEEMRFREHSFRLEEGDMLLVYTDGVAEAMNASGEFLGMDRILEILNSSDAAAPKEVVEDLKAGLDKFVADTEQFDDITMLGFLYRGDENKNE